MVLTFYKLKVVVEAKLEVEVKIFHESIVQ